MKTLLLKIFSIVMVYGLEREGHSLTKHLSLMVCFEL